MRGCSVWRSVVPWFGVCVLGVRVGCVCVVCCGVVLCCVVLCGVVWCCVVFVVVWHAENLCVCIQHVPVCAFKMSPCVPATCPREVHQKQPLDQTHLRFESRSRTTCHRFLQSFAFSDEAVQFQLS